eukprot:TRINITY_DN531_c0_g1_i1.p5 TRINITY_DN531_c0_g1~~TRINITY_DN531_c0_g1_i1.p5  ORF type:complete len:100 (+),score=9.65 TRINITY_DN531_c0_g1_i1:821-1120(+)
MGFVIMAVRYYQTSFVSRQNGLYYCMVLLSKYLARLQKNNKFDLFLELSMFLQSYTIMSQYVDYEYKKGSFLSDLLRIVIYSQCLFEKKKKKKKEKKHI